MGFRSFCLSCCSSSKGRAKKNRGRRAPISPLDLPPEQEKQARELAAIRIANIKAKHYGSVTTTARVANGGLYYSSPSSSSASSDTDRETKQEYMARIGKGNRFVNPKKPPTGTRTHPWWEAGKYREKFGVEAQQAALEERGYKTKRATPTLRQESAAGEGASLQAGTLRTSIVGSGNRPIGSTGSAVGRKSHHGGSRVGNPGHMAPAYGHSGFAAPNRVRAAQPRAAEL